MSRWRAAATAPSTIAAGAWSPPIASMAMRSNRELLLVYRPHLASRVVAAMRADAVRCLRLVALRAQIGRGRLQRIVRAALGRACLRVSAFWIRHRVL